MYLNMLILDSQGKMCLENAILVILSKIITKSKMIFQK